MNNSIEIGDYVCTRKDLLIFNAIITKGSKFKVISKNVFGYSLMDENGNKINDCIYGSDFIKDDDFNNNVKLILSEKENTLLIYSLLNYIKLMNNSGYQNKIDIENELNNGLKNIIEKIKDLQK